MDLIRKITRERPLKILGFTDMHLDDNRECAKLTMRLMAETVRSERPDLVVFAGDNVTGGLNRGRTELFVQTMNALRVPWAPILGNHEGDNPLSISRKEMAGEFSGSPFCMLPKVRASLMDGTPVYGETNYAIELKNEADEVIYKLIFLDCGPDTTPKELFKYGIVTTKKNPDGFIKPSQIAWYREQVRADSCESMLFCHIPLHEFREAFEKGTLRAGKNYESISTSPYNSGLGEAIFREARTGIFVAGHDHINTGRAEYRGVLWMYSRMSGLSSYNLISKGLSDRLLQGATIYYIDSEGQVSFDEVIYEERYPQYRDEIYSVIRR